MIRLSTKYINNYIDMTTTGNKYADRFLDISQKDYLRKTRNSVSEIKLMSPEEYFYWCSKGFGTDEARQYEVVSNDPDSLNHQLDMIHNGERLKLPYLNFSTFNGFGQDGRHRVYALKELGVEYLPVLWICDADSDFYDDSYCSEESNDKILIIESDTDKIIKSGTYNQLIEWYSSLRNDDKRISGVGQVLYGVRKGLSEEYKSVMPSEAMNKYPTMIPTSEDDLENIQSTFMLRDGSIYISPNDTHQDYVRLSRNNYEYDDNDYNRFINSLKSYNGVKINTVLGSVVALSNQVLTSDQVSSLRIIIDYILRKKGYVIIQVPSDTKKYKGDQSLTDHILRSILHSYTSGKLDESIAKCNECGSTLVQLGSVWYSYDDRPSVHYYACPKCKTLQSQVVRTDGPEDLCIDNKLRKYQLVSSNKLESYEDASDYIDKISESYLDDDQKFYDYHTGSVSGSDIFDTHKTGYSYYDNFLDDPEYMRKSKGKVGKIEMLTPEEYFQACADGFKVPYSQQIASTKADEEIIDHLKQVILQYKRKFPLTYLSKTSSDGFQQEGRHRMYVAGELVGWNTKFPVLIVRDA